MREKILDVLEKNGRIDLKEMAIMLGYSEAEVANEIADMEKEHIICGYNAVINWDKTSEEKVTALIEVKVTPQRGLGFDSIAERLYKYDEVTSVYLMSGGFDFTVIIEGKSMKSVAQFVAAKLAPFPILTHKSMFLYFFSPIVLCLSCFEDTSIFTIARFCSSIGIST